MVKRAKRRTKRPRYHAGYADGSGKDMVIDTSTGQAVASTRWGCGCCAPTEEPQHHQLAEQIARALNAKEK